MAPAGRRVGVAVEVFHLTCPLTQWENLMRNAAGQVGYGGGFIEHYVWPVIYPAGLTPSIQLGLGGVVLLINMLVYVRVFRQRKSRRTSTLSNSTRSL